MAKATLHNFEHGTPAKVLARGKQYFSSGRILKIKEDGPGVWEAEVEGAEEKYEVNVRLDRDEIIQAYSCDCPYDWGEMCKHTIAVLYKIRALKAAKKPETPAESPATAAASAKGVAAAAKLAAIFQPSAASAQPAPPPKAAPPIKRTTDQLVTYFFTLPDHEKKMLKLSSLLWEPFTQTTFIDSYNYAELKFYNTNLYAKEAAPLMAKFVSEGFWSVKNNLYKPDDFFAESLFERLVDKDPDFQKIAYALQRRSGSSFWVLEQGRRFFRDMRLARITGSLETFKNSYNGLLSPSSGSYTQASLTSYWLGDTFDKERLERIPARIVNFLLTEKLTLQTLFMLPPDAWGYYCSDQIAKFDEADRSNMARLLAQLCLLRGDWDGIQKLSPYLGDVNNHVFAATKLLLEGRTAGALEAFAQATKLLRKQTGYSKEMLQNMAGVFHLLAQFKSQDGSLYPKIADHLNKAIKNPSSYIPVFYWLNGVLHFLQNNKREALNQLSAGANTADMLMPFFKFFCQFWIDEKSVDKPQLKAFHQKALSNRFYWLASEAQALLAEFDPAYKVGLEEALAEAGVKEPLTKLLPRIEEWENALRLLQSIVVPASKKAEKENDARLAWLVDFERQYVAAKEQSFGKNGWGSGRAVAYKRLEGSEVTCMTEQDKRIVKAIGYGYGSEYHVNNSEVWKAMMGHPLLFLWKSPEIGVQLTEGKPTLLAKRNDEGGYALQFSHEVGEAGHRLVKETPTRYTLLHVTEQMAQIAKALNSRTLNVPERGEEQLKAIVAGLAGIVEVQSVFADENLPAVDPDARICVHLLPVGNGFHVELYVKPFAHTPPYVKPGDGVPTITTLIDGNRIRTTRDLKLEKKNVERLRKEAEILGSLRPREGVWVLDDAQQCLQLLMQLQTIVAEERIVLEWPKGEKFRISSVAGFDQFKMSVTEKGHWFEVSGELRVDEDKVLTMQELLALSQSKSQFVELSPGKFLALTEEFRKRLRQIDGLMSAQRGGSLQLHPLAAAALDPFTAALKNFNPDKKFKEQRQRLEQAFAKKFTLPKNFQAQLRPYQLEGFEWLHRCAAWGVGACLADDMGLGKTIQALAFLTDRAKLGPALVAAPASVCRNWVTEIAKFAPGLRSVLFGEGDRATEIESATKGDVVIVTYDLMAREDKLFTQKKFATLILDEAQAIKNRATKRSEVAMQLQGDFRMVMSGTPLENHLGELWNLFNFINPGLLGSIESFNERFALPIEKYKDEDRRDQLRRLVQPFILRRRKDEVLKDLPAKTEITLSVQLSPEERAFYEALRRNALEKLINSDAGAGEKHLQILAELMKLRRAACHPKLADENAKFLDSAKLRLFAEIVDELLENGHKALVFSQFVGHLQLLEGILKKKEITYQYLDGSTPLPLRQKRIEAFQAGEGDFFLISLKAGGTGLNLTAADYVIHTDPWWNPAVEDQATDRAHRIGQEKPVTVYRLVAEATIEEKILKLHEQKRDLADSLLSGTDVSAKLSAEELLSLMKEA